MSSHLIVCASCLIAALTANLAGAEPPKPKDGPQGMKFVPLPKGTFYMGWNGKEGSAKKTEIKEDFEIAVYTVTQGQWQAVMGKNPSYFSRDGDGKDKVKDIKDEELKQFPVEQVSWDDCQEFVKKMNEKEKGKGWVYRLPTEAEWEYACRGGATTEEECSHHFYFAKPTNDLSSKEANFNGNFPFGKGDKGPYLERTTKVGSYASNKLGLYDMHGNVWQWCADLDDPKDPASSRVDRGGGWASLGGGGRAAGRRAASRARRRTGTATSACAWPEFRRFQQASKVCGAVPSVAKWDGAEAGAAAERSTSETRPFGPRSANTVGGPADT